jgi:hypothetical protein
MIRMQDQSSVSTLSRLPSAHQTHLFDCIQICTLGQSSTERAERVIGDIHLPAFDEENSVGD